MSKLAKFSRLALTLGLGLFAIPAEHLLEDVRHVIHQVYRIIPANDQVTGLEVGLILLFRGSLGRYLWQSNITHVIKDKSFRNGSKLRALAHEGHICVGLDICAHFA